MLRCPSLYADSNLNLWLSNAALSLNINCLGSNYQLALGLRACHDYTMSNMTNNGATAGSAGNVTGKSEGNQSVNFANNVDMNSDLYLQSSNFGKELLSLLKKSSPRMATTANIGGC